MTHCMWLKHQKIEIIKSVYVHRNIMILRGQQNGLSDLFQCSMNRTPTHIYACPTMVLICSIKF